MEIERTVRCASESGDDWGEAMHLVWEDLTAVLPNFGSGPTKRLLDRLNGYAEPGKIKAIMGPSGSGKTTLLDALAGRLPSSVVMTGNILLNGKTKRLNCSRFGYVKQETALLGTLTVRETIRCEAHLRLSSTKKEIDDIAEGTIIEMGLQDCADRCIGSWHLRGISSGEKKRLSIALHILTKPQLLFLDEPTTGLDSASAFFVVQTLRNLAQYGRTVVSSVHQPSSEVLALFDDLCLLSGGEVVYSGGAKTAAMAGFPCPIRRSPSDHFLRCINSDFDQITMSLMKSKRGVERQLEYLTYLPASEVKAILVREYKQSNYAARERLRIREITATKVLTMTRNKSRRRASWGKQLSILTQRSFLNMWRDWRYYWVRIGIYVIVSTSVGTIFFGQGRSNSISGRGASIGFISGFMTFMSIGGFPSFTEELKIFHEDRMNKSYDVGVYILSNFLSSFPYVTLMSISAASITYYMVELKPDISSFTYACLNLISSIVAVESCMMTIALLVPNYLMGIFIGAGYIGILILTSGCFRSLPNLPKFLWRYPLSYINYAVWAQEGAYKNEMTEKEFDSLIPGGPKIKGEVYMTTVLGFNLEYSKWWDLAAVVAIAVAFKLLFYLIFKFKETCSPMLREINAKRMLRRLKKRPSFGINSTLPCKRHRVLHSLSSQVCLFSPTY